jgi:hypothetical protein
MNKVLTKGGNIQLTTKLMEEMMLNMEKNQIVFSG